MLEVEIDLIIYLGDMVEIVNVKICLGIDADFDGNEFVDFCLIEGLGDNEGFL